MSSHPFSIAHLTGPCGGGDISPPLSPVSPVSSPGSPGDPRHPSHGDPHPRPSAGRDRSPLPTRRHSTPGPTSRDPSPTPADSPGPDSPDKPPHSYIALISMAILSAGEKKMVLSDIYQYIMDNFGYYNNQERAWRNSIRHNLSLNECFIKAGRAENGKGNYWAIHPACVEDFAKGDYRRRQARRRARSGSILDHPLNISALPYQYRCGLGYVPMTTTPVFGLSPYTHPSLPYLGHPPSLPSPLSPGYPPSPALSPLGPAPRSLPPSLSSPIKDPLSHPGTDSPLTMTSEHLPTSLSASHMGYMTSGLSGAMSYPGFSLPALW